MKVVDSPGARFGQRGRAIGAPAAPPVHAPGPARGNGALLPGLAGVAAILLMVAYAMLWTVPQVDALNAQTAQAQQRIVAIVNQPVTHLRRTGQVTVFSPGWFHPGAITPDFDTVDIRATRELIYDGYVTSDVTPTEMFDGDELEFNSMTKYFYVDRNLPKKRLSNSEMVEINGLYRVLGQNGRSVTMEWLMLAGASVLMVVGIALLLLRNPNPSAD
ncbi:hypothetical protein [Mesorhizobium sp.]|uniref:hypothetical protein n=1 Tax=Mesorhizobium sp. TaxID=1871066 RepID=UPI0025FB414E|nr:hypothetical protein [Mesorhizobium sp.]